MFEKIIFSRSTCYGSCPEFDVIVNSNGTAKWFGGMHVYHVDEKEFCIDQGRLKQLAEKLRSIDFRHFTYPSTTVFATDQPYCTIWVKYEDGFVKEVEHYLGDSAEKGSKTKQDFQKLEKLENEIEMILGLKKLIEFPR
ncbi:DUF6438 domain-containing protein [Gracilibacillus thailandensis]|uniref:DUF6438 domain-containing protein n=1 Tax=Gracilibacillus thailandensis TaxID=563735 RepID=A0A6N7QWF3_9BACI|nr:DUF6438 domain-containing protein [Gracilibacillus thailandensis]MRI66338.1 hypothetical protein [Gracilibacillus thailandensis]